MPARIVRIVAVAVFALVWTTGVLLVTLRTTVLDADWYVAGFEEQDAFDRVYTQLLPDPAFDRLLKRLVADLPVDATVLTANARVVVPVATLRGVVRGSLEELTAYLRGDITVLDVDVPLDPLFEQVERVADHFLGSVVASVPALRAESLEDFGRSLTRFVERLRRGDVPDVLPTIPLGPGLGTVVADLLLDPVDADTRSRLEPQVAAELAAGDLNGALAVVAPAYASEHVERSVSDFRVEVGSTLDVEAAFAPLDDSPLFTALGVLRWTYGTAYVPLLAGLAAVGIACLAIVFVTTRRLGGRPWRAVAAAALVGAGVALAVWLAVVLVARVADPFAPLVGRGSPVPAGAARTLVSDLTGQLGDDFGAELAGRAALPAIAAMVALGGWAVAALVGRRVERPVPRAAAYVAGALVVVTLVGPWSFTTRITGSTERACNGAPELCDRRYDDVVYPATHNSMASSDAGFLGPMQDPTIEGQLDAGFRALLIDTHYWHTPAQVDAFLATLPAETAAALRPLIDPALRKPGTWLCHDLCQLGATRLVDALRAIKEWSEAHPDEVITLDIEDHINVADTVRAFEASGILTRVHTPPAPGQPWPTLREMIDDGRPIVVFAEKATDGPPWYPNLYEHAMETPYSFTSPNRMSCAPNRGGEGKRLFLLNHWITSTAASREDAAVLNQRAFVLERARRCERERGERPTWVAVDWGRIGDVTGAVRVLNGLDPP